LEFANSAKENSLSSFVLESVWKLEFKTFTFWKKRKLYCSVPVNPSRKAKRPTCQETDG